MRYSKYIFKHTIAVLFFMINTLSVEAQPVRNEPIGHIIESKISKNIVEGKTTNSNFYIESLNDGIFRIRIYKKIDELLYPIVFVKNDKFTSTISETADAIEIKTKEHILEIKKKPFRISFKDSKGNLLNEDAPTLGTSWLGDEVTTYKTLQPNEKFIGLGEKTGSLNRRGSAYTNWNRDTYGYSIEQDPIYASIPFYIGVNENKMYGVYMNNSYKSHFNFGASNVRFSYFTAEHGEMDYYYIGGENIPAIIENYTLLTGKMPLPPIWSLGLHQSRYTYFPDVNVINLANEFRSRKFPCDVFHLDIHHMDAYKIFTWDKNRFPNPKKMTDDLKKLGIRTTVIMDPGIKIEKGYKAYEDGIKNNYFLKYPDGENYNGTVWPGPCHFFDFTDAKQREYWGTLCNDYVKTGVDGFWNDMNEIAAWGDGKVPDIVEMNFEGNTSSYAKGKNIYGMLMTRSTYEGTKKALKKRPFLLTRSAFSGSQRYTAIWTGDNNPTEDHMLLGVRLVNSLGVSGMSFAGVDIGGFTGDGTKELFARWITIGTFTPFFRIHKGYDHKLSEPWSYGETVEKIAKEYVQLRYNLLPYLYSAMAQSTMNGLPTNKMLPIVYPFDEKVYSTQFENQFLFGNSFLVCPSESFREYTKVYLPEGSWYNFHSLEKYEGKKEYLEASPIHKLPIFIKEGSVVCMQSPILSTMDKNDGVLYVHVFNGSKVTETMLYEDDGESYDYEQGKFAKRKIIFDSQSKTLIFSDIEGGYASKYKSIQLYFHGFEKPIAKTTSEKFSFRDKTTNYYDATLEKNVQVMKINNSNKKIEISL